MLTVERLKTATETRYHFHSTGDDLTTVELENRKTGYRIDLKIFSRIPLSMGEIRDAVNAELGDHWQWRRLNTFAEYCPF